MREFLKGLELDKETIDTIMAEHGKLITDLKEQIDDYKNEIEDYRSQIDNYNNEIIDYRNQIDELHGTIDENNKSLESLQELTNENRNLKNEIQMNGSNVKKEFMKFVTSEVNSKVNDETDFATALEDYKKENPQYFGETVVKKVQSSPNLNGGTQEATTNNIMNDILRSAKD